MEATFSRTVQQVEALSDQVRSMPPPGRVVIGPNRLWLPHLLDIRRVGDMDGHMISVCFFGPDGEVSRAGL